MIYTHLIPESMDGDCLQHALLDERTLGYQTSVEN